MKFLQGTNLLQGCDSATAALTQYSSALEIDRERERERERLLLGNKFPNYVIRDTRMCLSNVREREKETERELYETELE